MLKVIFNKENIQKCQCVLCPVQGKSTCVKEKLALLPKKGLPEPSKTPKVYCSCGKATCQDLDRKKGCRCPDCAVWSDNHLVEGTPTLYFCFEGKSK